MVRPVLALVLGLAGAAQGAQLRTRPSNPEPLAALQLHQDAWVPQDLAVVDQAIKGLLGLKLSAEKHQAVEQAAAKVHQDLAAVTNGTKLGRAERRAKVGAALKEIQQLSETLAPPAPAAVAKNLTDIKARMATMKKELAEKTAKLAEEQKELKLDMMKKELMEKKLELQRLLSEKKKAQESQASNAKAAEDMKAQSEMVAKLVGMAKEMAAAKPAAKAEAHEAAAAAAPKPAALQQILDMLQNRTVSLKAAVAAIDAAEKKALGDLDGVAAKHAPHLGKDDALAKGQVLLDSLKKEEHRKFEKARALKKAEIAELEHAIESIKKGDVKALSAVLAKMKRETKALDARSGQFLH